MNLTIAFSAGSILFPLGADVRLTTIVAMALFVTLALAQHRWLPILSMLAWLFGFEFLFEAARLTVGNGDVLGTPHIVWEFALGLIFVPLAWRAGARPSRPLLLVALGVFAIWMATGFHVNEHTMVGFSPGAEVLNEISKLLWAAAYFVPLLQVSEVVAHPRASESPKAPRLPAEPRA